MSRKIMSLGNRTRGLAALVLLFATATARGQAVDPLPSWNEGAAKKAIVDFVSCATSDGCSGYIAPADRIAVFDNDGTLWCEQPLYFQFVFALERVKALAPQHPEWTTTEPFKSVLAGDVKTALAGGEKAILALMAATHAGMTTDEFEGEVRQWLATAKHPKFQRPYNECIYQPMVEVLAYLRANGFKTFIVSGGGVEYMRVWAEDAYGIPPEQVVGSSGKLKYEVRDGAPVIVKLPEVNFIDDGPGKPVGIEQHIGHRPVMAFGNSDGDFEMLEWTTSLPASGTTSLPASSTTGGEGARLGLIVHHTDGEREYAYDRGSSIGKLDRGLDEATKRGWVLIDMKSDWKTVFPAE